MQNELLISLFNRIRVTEPTSGETVDPTWVHGLNLELGVLGFTLDGPTMDAIKGLSRDAFIALQSEVRTAVVTISGTGVNHRVLFNKFPYATPEQNLYMAKRILGHFDSQTASNYQVLSCGHAIDPDLFNLSDFGACPICQREVPELASNENIRHDFRSITPLRVLGAADDAFLAEAATALLGRTSSLSVQERQFVLEAATLVEITGPTQTFRETLPLVYAVSGVEGVRPLVNSATDVLRIATFLSDVNSDLSLSTNVKFKIKTRDKKNLLSLLDQTGNLGEDMMRHRERWLRLGERLNPAAKVNAARYPFAAKAFDELRNAPKTISTFNRVVEKKTRAYQIDTVLLETLKKRPGELMRRLDNLLRHAGDDVTSAKVLAALDDVLHSVPTKLIFDVLKYFNHRLSVQGASADRVFFLKGEKTKMVVIPDNRLPVDATSITLACNLMRGELQRRFAKLPRMGKVFLAEDLKGVVLPFNRRGDSATAQPVVKGSRYPINPLTEVVRLFVWWKGYIDVDLSAVLLGENFDYVEQVSYTNLRSRKVVHSGDVQSAPNGATEFIDFDIADLRQQGIRYVAIAVISYRGQAFNEFPCFAGFMERDGLKSGARYEPESVRLKFDIDTNSTSHLPLAFDLETRELVFVDLTQQAGRHQGVAGQGDRYAAATRSVLETTQRKPTFHDVLFAHALARGTIVSTREEADTVYELDGLDIEAIMGEMLA
jgi:hypothetical protein